MTSSLFFLFISRAYEAHYPTLHVNHNFILLSKTSRILLMLKIFTKFVGLTATSISISLLHMMILTDRCGTIITLSLKIFFLELLRHNRVSRACSGRLVLVFEGELTAKVLCKIFLCTHACIPIYGHQDQLHYPTHSEHAECRDPYLIGRWSHLEHY